MHCLFVMSPYYSQIKRCYLHIYVFDSVVKFDSIITGWQYMRGCFLKAVSSMLCDSCGYRNIDNAKKCMGCGAALKPKMSGGELSAMLNEMSDRSDPLTASRFDKIMGLVFFSLSLINLIVSIFFSSQPKIGVIPIVFAIFGGVNARYPKVIWAMNKMRLRFYTNADDLTPNDLWAISRRISYYFILIIIIGLTVISLLV